MSQRIRLATKHDSKAILEIYAPYIIDTAISFETSVPDEQEFTSRVDTICNEFPYLVYVIDDTIVGYCYASKHRERSAYRFDVDLSVYIIPEYHGAGIAKKLYECLFEILKVLGYINVYAGYTVPNEKSKIFHEKFGFTLVGTYHKVGYKFEKWHDVVWLEKTINKHSDKPSNIKSIGELSEIYLDEIFLSCTIDKHFQI